MSTGKFERLDPESSSQPSSAPLILPKASRLFSGALSNGDLKLVQKILDASSSYLKESKSYAKILLGKALLYAIQNNNVELVKLLVKHPSTDTNYLDREMKKMPLVEANRYGFIEIIAILEAAGANGSNISVSLDTLKFMLLSANKARPADIKEFKGIVEIGFPENKDTAMAPGKHPLMVGFFSCLHALWVQEERSILDALKKVEDSSVPGAGDESRVIRFVGADIHRIIVAYVCTLPSTWWSNVIKPIQDLPRCQPGEDRIATITDCLMAHSALFRESSTEVVTPAETPSSATITVEDDVERLAP